MRRTNSDVSDVLNAGRLDASLNSFTGNISRLRADSVSLGHQRLTRKHDSAQDKGGGAAAFKAQMSSLDLQGDGRDDDGAAVGCGAWFLRSVGSHSRRRSSNGGIRSTENRSSSSSSLTSSGRQLSGRVNNNDDDDENEENDEDDDDKDGDGHDTDSEEKSPSLVLRLRSWRSGFGGWSSRMRLRLLGGSSRIVILDGQAYSLRTHLKTNKPKRSALRSTTLPHSRSQGQISLEEGGTSLSSSCAMATSSESQTPTLTLSKKKLRFATSVLEANDGIENGCCAGTDASPGAVSSVKTDDDGRGGEDGKEQKRELGEGTTRCFAAGGGGALDDIAASPPMERARHHQVDRNTAAMEELAGGDEMTAAVCGVTSRCSGGGSSGSHTRWDASATTASALVGSFSQAAVGAGSRQGPRKLMARSSQGSGRVRPQGGDSSSASGASATTAAAAAAATSIDEGLQPEETETARGLSPTPTPTQLLSSSSSLFTATVAMAGRPPSLLGRVAMGTRDSGSSAGFSVNVTPRLHSNSVLVAGGYSPRSTGDSSGSEDELLAGHGTPGSSGHAVAKQVSQLSAPPSSPPGRYISTQILRSSLFGTDSLPEWASPHNSVGVDGGNSSSAVGGDSVQRITRSTSYTAPGMIVGRTRNRYENSDGGVGAAMAPAPVRGAASKLGARPPQTPSRRQFLAAPSLSSGQVGQLQHLHKDQQPMRQRQLRSKDLPKDEGREGTKEMAEVAEMEEEGEQELISAPEKAKLKRTTTMQQQGQGKCKRHGEGERELTLAPQWWATSVRPVGDDAGDDVSDGGDAVDPTGGAATTASMRRFNWLKLLRRSRSFTGRWAMKATESRRRQDGDGPYADADELLGRLGRGNSMIEMTDVTHLGAYMVQGGRTGDDPPSAAVETPFDDFPFTAQSAIRAAQDSTAARSRAQQVPYKQESDGGPYGDAAAAGNIAVTTERDRQIRAAPFTAAIGLLKPITSVSAPVPKAVSAAVLVESCANTSASSCSAGARWEQQLLTPQMEPQQPQPQQQQQQQSFSRLAYESAPVSATSVSSIGGTLATTTASMDDRASYISASASSAAFPPGLNLTNFLSQPPTEHASPSPSAAEVADWASAAARLTAGKLRMQSPRRETRLSVFAVSEDPVVNGGGGGGDPEEVLEPPLASPMGHVVVLETPESEDLLRRQSIIGGGGGGASSFTPLKAPLTSYGNTPSPSSSSNSRNNVTSAAPAMLSPRISREGFVLTPVHARAAAGPWVEDSCTQAGSGMPFAEMTVSLAKALAAPMDMKTSGVSADAGKGRTAAHHSYALSAPFSTSMELLQQQLHARTLTAGSSVNSMWMRSSSVEIKSERREDPKTAAVAAVATTAIRLPVREEGGGGSSYLAARTAVQREAAADVSSSGGSGGNGDMATGGCTGPGCEVRTVLKASSFQLPGGVELIEDGKG